MANSITFIVTIQCSSMVPMWSRHCHMPCGSIEYVVLVQGFMQDKVIASHTCFGGHMDVNC